ncbi:hypothetical protein BGW80DRAFT_1253226 [Lactifluus volemus]|nr:hypothetical protein BGW80DRAFT_1253226 [Lactifluus volemus]
MAQFEIKTTQERNLSSLENLADSSTGRDEEEAELGDGSNREGTREGRAKIEAWKTRVGTGTATLGEGADDKTSARLNVLKKYTQRSNQRNRGGGGGGNGCYDEVQWCAYSREARKTTGGWGSEVRGTAGGQRQQEWILWQGAAVRVVGKGPEEQGDEKAAVHM